MRRDAVWIDPLTEHQREVYDLRHSTDPPMPWASMGRVFGQTGQQVGTVYRKAARKLGLSGRTPEKKPDSDGTTAKTYTETGKGHLDPDRKAALMMDAARPGGSTIQALAERAGVSEKTASRIAKEIDTKYVDVFRDVKEITSEVFSRAFEHLGMRALSGITDAMMDKMNPYQRAVIAAICIDKRELLSGRPTERISVEDRRQLPELLAVVLEEAKRRGLQIGTNPSTLEGQVTVDEDAHIDVRSGRKRWTPTPDLNL